MTVQLLETVDATGSAASNDGRLRVRNATPEDATPSALHVDDVRKHRALHLWCRDPEDLDEIIELDPIGYDYLAVALGRGLDSTAQRDALLERFQDTAAQMTTPVLWHTVRGSVGQNLVRVRDILRHRPELRIALDYPEVYCAHEMLLGRTKRWRDVLKEIGPQTTTMITGDGDSERDPYAPRHQGPTSTPLRWLYSLREHRVRKAVAPRFVCSRSNQ